MIYLKRKLLSLFIYLNWCFKRKTKEKEKKKTNSIKDISYLNFYIP
ncbi:hypothetical protein DOY81_009599, partial [Sarcophaga bullata]